MVGIRWSHSLTIIYYRNTIKNKCVISSRLWETLDAAEVDVKSQKSTQEESRARCAAVSVSVVAHAVALGTLLMLKPVLHLAPPLAVIEISLVPDQAPGRLHANNPSGAPPGETAAEVSVAPFLSLTRPAVTRKASSPVWSRSVDTARSFDMSSLPTFRPRTHALASDTLATTLD